MEACWEATLQCHQANRTEIWRNGLKRKNTVVILQVQSNNRLIISMEESIKVKLTPYNGNNLVQVGATKFCQVPSNQTHWASVTERENGWKSL